MKTTFSTSASVPESREEKQSGSISCNVTHGITGYWSLYRAFDEKGAELYNLDPKIFSNVPVVLYEESDETHHLTLMALKHISGNKKWGEWNQAKLVEKLNSDFGLSEDDICQRIGISKVAMRRSLRALSFLRQYRESDYGDQYTETKFPIFREVVRNAALKEWLEWDD